MTKYIDSYRLWNDFFPFGHLILDYYWVLEGDDTNEDGIIETAAVREIGHARGYSIETVWSDVADAEFYCPDGHVIAGKKVDVIIRARPFTQSFAILEAYSASLSVFPLNCADGELTPGAILDGDLNDWLHSQKRS